MPGVFLISYIQQRRLERNQERIQRRCLRDMSNPMSIPDVRFINLYRINKEAFSMILDEISPSISQGSIPETIQLAAVLRFLAVGAFQGVVANDVNISLGRSTFSKVMWKVMDTLETKLCSKWIQLEMNQEDTQASKLYFYEKHRLPGVIGCVDGTHVRILKPSIDESLYYNRKGYFSLNVLIICDFKMRIRAVDACRPGSCHDSFIWGMSEAKKYFKQMYENGEKNSWLLGDAGYPLEPFLMTPYRSPQHGTKEHVFNMKHCSGRNIVERTIGNLKSRFRCLQCTTLHYSPEKVVKIINVCSTLHNICKHFNTEIENTNEPQSDDNNGVEDDENPENSDREATIIRDAIANSLIR